MKLEQILIKHFEWTEQEVKEKANIILHVTFKDEQKVLDKAKFYQQEFDLSRTDFIKMLKVLPTLLNLSEESVKAKANFYQQEFDLNRAEFIKMLKGLPVLLSLLEESVKEKHKQILDLNIPKSVIIKNPNILTVPTNTLKVRYTILRQVATREDILSKIWFMTSQDKTYARLRYLQNKSNKIKISHLLQDEKRFVNAYGVESKELMKIYKLTPEAIHKMQEVLEDGEMEEFGEEEKQFINEEYGV